MKQFLVEFRAQTYCQGFEWSWLQRLVEAESFEHACIIIKKLKTDDWEYNSPQLFKNLTI